MNTSNYLPNNTLSDLYFDLDHIFDGFCRGNFNPKLKAAKNSDSFKIPAVNIYDKEDAYNMEFEIPGVAPEKIDISLNGNVLTIKGEKEDKKECKEGECCVSERHHGSFQRSIQLPENADLESITASNKHGVVTVTVKKAKDKGVKKIALS